MKVFKAFWHWYQRVEREEGRSIDDITTYIDASPVRERSFVYLTDHDVKRLADHARFNYKVLIWFLFDSGIRAPGETG